ncbi:phosphate starvation protein [Ammoniphilus oxalaticus]|uniref:Phosphate starvation protein n=1 Tax=Ammoniphilus oxalaticus TaxID=66863 RepID=A0A419SQS0_9BACL|nr:universal stress protein [Ammoniphilus oxalaticus]RKD26747.1 phosphate starvation protein [Ammoniphilus oxalaticus]
MLSVCSRIVVPYDGSELSKKALNTAIQLAKQDEKIQINAVTVLSIPDRLAYNDGVRESYFKAAKELEQEIEESLKTLPNNETKITVLEGNPGAKIVEFSKDNGVDLVIMGSRGLSGLQEWFLGSVSQYVVQKSACPVYITK